MIVIFSFVSSGESYKGNKYDNAYHILCVGNGDKRSHTTQIALHEICRNIKSATIFYNAQDKVLSTMKCIILRVTSVNIHQSVKYSYTDVNASCMFWLFPVFR